MHVSDVLVLALFACALIYVLVQWMPLLRPFRTQKTVKSAEPESCGTCAHFDAEAGRRVVSDHPIFVAATQAVAPWRMVATYDDDGNPTKQPSPEMLRTGWEAIGLCLVADENGNRECVMATCVGCPKGAYVRKAGA
jgi:hypothetical protein